MIEFLPLLLMSGSFNYFMPEASQGKRNLGFYFLMLEIVQHPFFTCHDIAFLSRLKINDLHLGAPPTEKPIISSG